MSTSVPALGVLRSGPRAIGRARAPLLAGRRAEGFWDGGWTASYAPDADYVLLQWWLHPSGEGGLRAPRPDLVQRAVRSILSRQAADGGFPLVGSGPAGLADTVRAYCALKLGGLAPEDPRMRAARERILALGGLEAIDELTGVTLGLFGFGRTESGARIPAGLPVAIGFPGPAESWSRTIALSLVALRSRAAARPVPPRCNACELFAGATPSGAFQERSTGSRFGILEKLGRWLRPQSPDAHAARAAETWLIRNAGTPDCLAAGNPAAMYMMMALDAVGCPAGAPTRVELERRSHEMLPEAGPALVDQRFLSPVHDTALAATALLQSGLVSGVELENTVDWLAAQDVGGSAVTAPMVLLALQHALAAGARPRREAFHRLTQGLVGAQGRGGGWPVFEADLETLPAPSRARNSAPVLDPSAPDVTGLVLEALCSCGLSGADPPVRRGVRFLIESQEPEGSWRGRWGTNRLYATFRALRGLRAAGVDGREACVLRAAEWIRSIQSPDGGWGEADGTSEYVPLPGTPSQTAWAVLGLLAAGDVTSDSVGRGVERLLSAQQPDGNWRDIGSNLPGIPGVVALTGAISATCFPLLALAECVKAAPLARRMT